MFLRTVTLEGNKRSGRRRVKYTTLFNDQKNFTDIKALFSHVGQDIYKCWTGFNIGDICKHVDLYALGGIAPDPRTDMKFKIHDEDQVNGSNLCSKIFGP